MKTITENIIDPQHETIFYKWIQGVTCSGV